MLLTPQEPDRRRGRSRALLGLAMLALGGSLSVTTQASAADADQPSIGVHNISAFNHGIMGYQTANIDRIANEGGMLTHYYAQQSCTAGRAACRLWRQ